MVNVAFESMNVVKAWPEHSCINMWVGLIIQIVSLIKFQISNWIVEVAIYKTFSSSLIVFWEEGNQIFIENSKKKIIQDRSWRSTKFNLGGMSSIQTKQYNHLLRILF